MAIKTRGLKGERNSGSMVTHTVKHTLNVQMTRETRPCGIPTHGHINAYVDLSQRGDLSPATRTKTTKMSSFHTIKTSI